jgi:hypothetical protein
MLTELNAVQIRVSLNEIEPDIWRRLVVPLQWNLEQLHLTIQAAFNWWDSHLHEFRIGGLRYGDVDALDEDSVVGDPRTFEQREVRLSDFREPGVVFSYIYDFGDNWRHAIEIEKFLALDETPKHASCIGGARARPPEDVGGVSGYEEFLTILANSKHPEHAETKRWCGGHFDPEWCDLAIAQKHVQNALKPNVRRPLHQPKPKSAKPAS